MTHLQAIIDHIAWVLLALPRQVYSFQSHAPEGAGAACIEPSPALDVAAVGLTDGRVQVKQRPTVSPLCPTSSPWIEKDMYFGHSGSTTELALLPQTARTVPRW